MAEKISSVLIDAASKLTRLNKSSTSMQKTQSSYTEFLRFMDVETNNLKAIKFDKKKLNKLPTINVTSTFGDTGNLLNSLFSGALDLGGFIGDIVGGGKKKPNAPAAPTARTPKPIPKGNRIRLPNIRGLGVLSALFAAVDFAGGLQEGESPAKAATGAAGSAVGGIGGALAGAAIAGAIGQTFVPIPGLGFVLGAALGSLGAFGGGYAADRAYETVTGEGQTREKDLERQVKEQEKKQKELSATNAAKAIEQGSIDKMLLKFENVVYKFEVFANNFSLTSAPDGYDEELSDMEIESFSPPDVNQGEGELGEISYGSGNATFGETGNVSNAPGWVHGHFQGTSKESVVRDTTMVVKALLSQGSPVWLKPGIDLLPSKKYSDDELRSYVERARQSHTHSGSGKSIDVFVRKGTKVPISLTNVGPTGSDYGGYGRGGIAGYIPGTSTWIGHLTPGSKGGLSSTTGTIKPKGQESPDMSNLAPSRVNSVPQTTRVTNQRNLNVSSVRMGAAVPKTPQTIISNQTTVSPNNLKPNTTSVTSSIQQYQQYPTYNQTQSMTTLIPIIPPQNSSSPVIVSSGSGGGGVTIIPSISEGEVVNALMKTMLLTNLSST